MTDMVRAPSTVRTAVVWDALRQTLAERTAATGRATLDVVDAGGGTGGFAVPLAELGHSVTVVDASPDSLAALERRAAEAQVTERVRALQGEVGELLELVGADSADLVLCHSLLEYVDDPYGALAATTRTARVDGTVSVLVANRTATVIHKALAGHFEEARHALDDPDGRWGDRDPVPRRFTLAAITQLLEDVGLRVDTVHGVRVFADVVPGNLVNGEPAAAEALLALEAAAAGHPALQDVATQLHLLGHR
ncbi:MAG: methyltransferase domain-containing protein [Streptosporangiales bacterium]|nr:methyltransferase domain-containing protein [Streptosporangiales bacterium]